MHMSHLNRRLQVLIDEERYQRLRRHAEKSGASVGALAREAIDRTFPALPPDRARAAAAILDLDPMPIGDWGEIEAEIEAAYERGPGPPR